MQKIKQIFLNNLYVVSLYSRQIAGTLILFIIARYLSIYDYGLFSSYKAIATFLLVLANMGFEAYILVSSKNNVKKVRLKIALFLLNAFSLLAIFSLVVPFISFESKLLFILVLFRQFFDGTFFALILPYFQSKREFIRISLINIFYAFFIILIACVSYIFKLSLVNFLYLILILGVINFIQCSYFSKIPYCLVLNHLKKSLNLVEKSILHFMIVNICFILYSQIPSVYIASFVHKEQSALFFSAFTIANIILLCIGAQCQKLMPEFIDAKVHNVRKMLFKSVKESLCYTVGILIFFVFFGKLVLKLLYSQDYYTNAYYILLILSLGNVFYGVGKVYITYIMSKHDTNIIWKMQIEAIIISVLVLFLFNKFAVYAAAIAYFASATHIGIRYTLKTKQLLLKNELLEKNS